MVRCVKVGVAVAVPGGRPGESEYSHGPGMFPNPRVDYTQNGKHDGFGPRKPGVTDKDVCAGGGGLQDQLRQMAAYKRLNSAAVGENIDGGGGPDFAGNPDRFGAQPPLVQTPPDTIFPPLDLEPVAKFQRRW